jgi:hypothetical protein
VRGSAPRIAAVEQLKETEVAVEPATHGAEPGPRNVHRQDAVARSEAGHQPVHQRRVVNRLFVAGREHVRVADSLDELRALGAGGDCAGQRGDERAAERRVVPAAVATAGKRKVARELDATSVSVDRHAVQERGRLRVGAAATPEADGAASNHAALAEDLVAQRAIARVRAADERRLSNERRSQDE